MSAIYAWIWNCMLSVWYENFFTSLPFACLYDCVWFLPLRWSSTLLMWADVRTSGSGNNRDAAVWWYLGRLSGSLWRGLSVWSLVVVVVVVSLALGEFCISFRPVEPLHFVIDMLGYCVRHIPSFRTLWIFNICGVYLNWFYLFNWDVTVYIDNN